METIDQSSKKEAAKAMMDKRRFIGDVVLNFVATGLPLTLLQLVALPLISKRIGAEQYGLSLTMVALMNTVPGMLGNTLNNIRLLKNEQYHKAGFDGDFNPLLVISSVFAFVVTVGFALWYERAFTLSVVLTAVLSIVWLLREYYIVAFRIKLNYRRIVLCNAIQTIGYGIGLLIFMYVLPIWQLVYLIGYILSLIYIIGCSTLAKESYKRTPFYKSTLQDSAMLATGGLLTRITSYAEKLIMFPMLGGAAVSIYYAASIFGKLISISVTPITSVVLSYLAKLNAKPGKMFNAMLLMLIGIGIVGYLIIVVISGPVLRLLYPEYVDQALALIPLTALIAVISIIIAVIHPFILRYQKMIWQIFMNGIVALVFIPLTMILAQSNGIRGFCIALVITNLIKLSIMLVVYWRKPTTDGVGAAR